MPIFTVNTHHALPQVVGGTVISPRSQHIQAQLPFFELHLAWSRPLDVTVLYPDGQQQVIPIVDVTRVALIGMFLFGSVGALVLRRMMR